MYGQGVENHWQSRARCPGGEKKYVRIGWYPELVFILVVFSNSTNLEVVILNGSVYKIYFIR